MSYPTQSTTWKESIDAPRHPTLDRSKKTDVVIVGGGITGITSAYLLAQSGKKVIVLEKGTIGYCATGMTTAFLNQIIDTDLSDVINIFGKDAAKAIVQSHQKAIGETEKIIIKEKIDCEFRRCSHVIYAPTEKDTKILEQELEAGDSLDLNMCLEKKNNLGFSHAAYLEVSDQALFHPLKYMYALAKKAVEAGVEIYQNTEVTDISEEKGIIKAVTSAGTITAQYGIVATYMPLGQPLKLFFKKAEYISYILEGTIPHGKIPEGTYEDTDNPYHYFRIDNRGTTVDRIIIGGEDHRGDIKIDHEKCFKALEQYTRKILGSLTFDITRKWYGPIIEPSDGLPLIGAINTEKIFYATGFSGNGMTYSHIAAQVFVDLCHDKKHPWLYLYRANRFPSFKSLLVKGRDYSQELMKGAVKNSLEFDSTRKKGAQKK